MHGRRGTQSIRLSASAEVAQLVRAMSIVIATRIVAAATQKFSPHSKCFDDYIHAGSIPALVKAG